eukprot:CFRG6018T1
MSTSSDNSKTYTILVSTWNMGNAKPPKDLTDWLGGGIDYDFVAVGAQEADWLLQKKGVSSEGTDDDSIEDQKSKLSSSVRRESAGDVRTREGNSPTLSVRERENIYTSSTTPTSTPTDIPPNVPKVKISDVTSQHEDNLNRKTNTKKKGCMFSVFSKLNLKADGDSTKQHYAHEDRDHGRTTRNTSSKSKTGRARNKIFTPRSAFSDSSDIDDYERVRDSMAGFGSPTGLPKRISGPRKYAQSAVAGTAAASAAGFLVLGPVGAVIAGGSAFTVLKTSDAVQDYMNDFFDRILSAMGDEYVEVARSSLLEIKLLVMVRKSVANHISKVVRSKEATGLGDFIGNKGGCGVKFTVEDTTICFVSAHLAAHEGEKFRERRNQDVSDIINGMWLKGPSLLDLTNYCQHVFWMGDLNYRVDLSSHIREAAEWDHERKWEYVVDLIEKGRSKELMKFDELSHEHRHLRVFAGFEEGEIDFEPTFKVLRGEQGRSYLAQRIPSFCDRILWHSQPSRAGNVHMVKYKSIRTLATSDHKPVCGSFRLIIPAQRKKIKKKLWKGDYVTAQFTSMSMSQQDDASMIVDIIGGVFCNNRSRKSRDCIQSSSRLPCTPSPSGSTPSSDSRGELAQAHTQVCTTCVTEQTSQGEDAFTSGNNDSCQNMRVAMDTYACEIGDSDNYREQLDDAVISDEISDISESELASDDDPDDEESLSPELETKDKSRKKIISASIHVFFYSKHAFYKKKFYRGSKRRLKSRAKTAEWGEDKLPAIPLALCENAREEFKYCDITIVFAHREITVNKYHVLGQCTISLGALMENGDAFTKDHNFELPLLKYNRMRGVVKGSLVFISSKSSWKNSEGNNVKQSVKSEIRKALRHGESD